MSNRNPKVQELEQLYAIKESPPFQEYLKLLRDSQNKTISTLIQTLVTPEQVANHNYKVGLLAGIEAACVRIDVIIGELERELKLEQAQAELDKPKQRKVQHQ